MAVKLRRNLKSAVMFSLALVATVPSGCESNQEQGAMRTEQALNEAKTKSDALNDVTRNLAQITPLNRERMGQEVQLHLNKWLQNAPKDKQVVLPAQLLDGLPPDLRSDAGFANVGDGQFSEFDVEYIFQCRLISNLAGWVVTQPLRDALLTPWLEKQTGNMREEDRAALEQGLKLFDWSVRNVVLEGDPKDVETLPDDPRKPLNDRGLGYRYLPWQTALYSRGDFVNRGRVFTALAQQRGLDTCWLALRLPTSPSAKLWAVGLLIGDKCYVLEPRLGLPILHPDTLEPATLAEIQKDEKILRRLDVPGRFDYAVNPGDAAKVEFLIELEPSAVTDRMFMLQSSLTGSDRLVLTPDVTSITSKMKSVLAGAPVSIWQMPLLARVFAVDLRNRLQMNTPFTAGYMIEHAAWNMNTPSATARLKHLSGEFENSFDARGALASYMDCRIDDKTIDRLPDDPDVQKELMIPRGSSESLEEFQARLRQYQVVFRIAKLDANMLLGQLHFDLGNYRDVEGFLGKRTLGVPQAARWFPGAHYTLGRAYLEQGKTTEAIKEFNEDGSPMEAGNRLRARYVGAMTVKP